MVRISGAVLIALLAAGPAGAEVVAPQQVIFDDGAVPSSLTGVPGNAEVGRTIAVDRKLGNCLACHENTDLAAEPFHGEVAPPLDGVADRWSEAELRGILINSKMMFEGTIMPAFYRDTGYSRILPDFEGMTILDAQQVEDVLAYLLTLTE